MAILVPKETFSSKADAASEIEVSGTSFISVIENVKDSETECTPSLTVRVSSKLDVVSKSKADARVILPCESTVNNSLPSPESE